MVVRGEGDGTLTNHPAKQQVVDFLKNLVVDSLSLPPASKTPHTIDLLLEVSGAHLVSSAMLWHGTALGQHDMDAKT